MKFASILAGSSVLFTQAAFAGRLALPEVDVPATVVQPAPLGGSAWIASAIDLADVEAAIAANDIDPDPSISITGDASETGDFYSTENFDRLYVGRTGIGSMSVIDSTVNVTEEFGLATIKGSSGTLTLNGGTLNVQGAAPMLVGAPSFIDGFPDIDDGGSGNVSIRNNSQISAPSIELGNFLSLDHSSQFLVTSNSSLLTNGDFSNLGRGTMTIDDSSSWISSDTNGINIEFESELRVERDSTVEVDASIFSYGKISIDITSTKQNGIIETGKTADGSMPTFSNAGTVTFSVSPDTPAGTYTPIIANGGISDL
ncbi:MAG: hypothetical protein ACQKBV_11885, partial [Puniceicoccales bacterium]